MKVLIDIDDNDYADIMSDSERNLNHYERLIKKGVPQITGHEDCISRAEAIKAIRNYNVTIEVGRAIGKSQLADIVDSINKVQEKMISELPSIQPTVKENLVVEDCISRQAVIDAFERFIHELGIEDEPYNYGEMALSAKNVPSVTPQPKTDFEHKAEIVISQLRADRDRLQDALEKIKVEIKEWYWQADKQALAKDPCVVDAMIDLFIRTIDKYKAESEE